MDFYRFRVSIVIGLLFVAPSFADWEEDYTVPTSYKVYYLNVPSPTPMLNNMKESNVTIGVHVKKATDVIVLGRSVQMAIYNAKLNGTDCALIMKSYEPIMTVKVPYMLAAGENYELEIQFSVYANSIVKPNFDYVNPLNGEKAVFAFGIHREHVYESFPCYRNPGHRASISMNIVQTYDVPPHFFMSAGTETISRELADKSEWGPTPSIMPINKFGLLTGNFILVSYDISQDGPYYYYLYSHAEAILLPRDLRIQKLMHNVHLIVMHVASYLSTKLMPNKIEFIALPQQYPEAHDSWGLIYIHERFFILNSMFDQHRMYLEVTRAIVHQYFGILVTTEPDRYTWLTDGIGNFLAHKFVNHLFPKFASLSYAHIHSYQHAMREDGTELTSELNSKPSKDISTHKGASILRMLETVLGEEVIRYALTNYFIKGQTEYMDSDDFGESLNTAAKQFLTVENFVFDEVLDSWTSKKGYPLVSVSINETFITFKQERFFYNKRIVDSHPHTHWHIPLWIPVREELIWFANESMTIERPRNFAGWTLATASRNGFFRMNFPENVWRDSMVAQLESDNYVLLSSMARARLIDDALSLAYAGYLPYKTALRTLNYLKKETSYRPWATAYEHFNFFQRIIPEEDLTKRINLFIKRRIGPLFDKYKLIELYNETLSVKSLRNIAIDLAGRSGYRDPSKWGSEILFKKYDENIRETIGCNMVRVLGYSVHSILKSVESYIMNVDYRLRRTFFLRVLTCTNDQNVLNDYVWALFESKALTHDSEYLPELFARNVNYDSIGVIVERLIDFIEFENNQQITSKSVAKDRHFQEFIELLGKRIVGAKFVKSYRDLVPKMKNVGKIQWVVNENMQWREKYVKVVNSFFGP